MADWPSSPQDIYDAVEKTKERGNPPTVFRPTPEQRAEMASFINEKQPGLPGRARDG